MNSQELTPGLATHESEQREKSGGQKGRVKHRVIIFDQSFFILYRIHTLFAYQYRAEINLME